MKRLLAIPAVIAVMLTGATIADAAQSTGSITKVDMASHTITLSDGEIYQFTPAADLSQIMVGQKVTVMFSTDDATGTNDATAVAPALG